jgi:hypothetical protein
MRKTERVTILTPREEHTLWVTEKRVLIRMFGAVLRGRK